MLSFTIPSLSKPSVYHEVSDIYNKVVTDLEWQYALEACVVRVKVKSSFNMLDDDVRNMFFSLLSTTNWALKPLQD